MNFLNISHKNYFYLIAGFSLITIFASILLALYTITDNYTSLSHLDKAYGIDERIDKIYSALKDEENQQRGYLIAYQPSFIKSSTYNEKLINREYSAIYDVLKCEKSQQNNLSVFRVEIKMKLKSLELGRNYFLEGTLQEDSLRAILTEGDFIMANLRNTITTLKKMEYKRFSNLREKTIKKSELSIFVVAITSGISILLLISTLIALRRENLSKSHFENQLIASEHQLQQQVQMLNMSNKELEQFAYVASHDLEEPLRKISSFSEKIHLKLENYPDDEVLDWLKRLNNSVDRMRTFINDLLNYSRITRMLDVNENVKLDSIFKLILEDLEVAIVSKNASVSLQAMPEIKGNNTQIKQLFQNLINNALKFSDKANPQIQVTGKYYTADQIRQENLATEFNPQHKNYYCIFVSDNGIGFELQYLKQIFVIFQRLNGRSEYEGTGIGLAICKRIVDNHEGFITAESEVGKGTVFIVGLPIMKV